ncbi:hypothetical protein pb186bvf_005783 [Paramecium bursaria]
MSFLYNTSFHLRMESAISFDTEQCNKLEPYRFDQKNPNQKYLIFTQKYLKIIQQRFLCLTFGKQSRKKSQQNFLRIILYEKINFKSLKLQCFQELIYIENSFIWILRKKEERACLAIMIVFIKVKYCILPNNEFFHCDSNQYDKDIISQFKQKLSQEVYIIQIKISQLMSMRYEDSQEQKSQDTTMTIPRKIKYSYQKKKRTYVPQRQVAAQFTFDEDVKILHFVLKQGPKFHKICKRFNGKTMSVVKNRYYKNLRFRWSEILGSDYAHLDVHPPSTDYFNEYQESHEQQNTHSTEMISYVEDIEFESDVMGPLQRLIHGLQSMQ